MTSSFVRLSRICLLLAVLLPVVVTACSRVLAGAELTLGFLMKGGAAVAGLGIASCLLGLLLKRIESRIDDLSRRQADFLDSMPAALVGGAILASACLSLFLELAVIRWQSTVWEFFAFYKNLGLLSCFAGLGLGYALARDRIPLVLTAPLLAVQMGLMIFLRHGMASWRIESLMVMPFREQLNMGFKIATSTPHYVAVYSFVAVVFLLTALAFVPIGQLCGRLLERTVQLRAYGLNLLGSLAGVVLMLGVSFLWTPPTVWFVLCFAVLIVFQIFDRRSTLVAVLSSLTAVVILAWPVSFLWERIYSPYQLLERGRGEHGLTMIRAAGHYYQRVHDLSAANQQAFSDLRELGNYYEFPYRVHAHPFSVAVVGAGTGNDVAAALRAGAREVDAIEIDPAILALGAFYHPEKPYYDERVRRIVNDARSFLRTTTNRYDVIAYGLLDSHTLLSHASSVRLDSFVYTVEGLKESRARLKENGVVSLSFCVLSPEIGRKIYLMMQQAFDGHAPVCVEAGYDGSVIFLQSRDGDLAIPPETITKAGFKDITTLYADASIRADVSTDDWPFFYMPARVYPTSYVFMVLLVLLLSVLLFASFFREKPRFGHASFFFLGAGFMLVETKGITEMGLTFGNTWQVIGIVIAGILVMAYLANCFVQWFGLRNPRLPFVLLLVSLGVGLVVAKRGGFAPLFWGKVLTTVVLTSPMFFSGMVFSTLLARTREISAVMAFNLLGAMCGGLLEYNSMYFGFQFLYLIAGVLYLAALAASYLKPVSQTGNV